VAPETCHPFEVLTWEAPRWVLAAYMAHQTAPGVELVLD